MKALRADLPPLPQRMRHLPVDHRGFPVPWFVQFVRKGTMEPCRFADDKDAEPYFPAADIHKLAIAVRQKHCWVCGGTLGKHLAFVIGPMCVINRTTSEPPCHRECAEFSARACPFLSRPRMKRVPIPDEMAGTIPGYHLDRNPGCACVYITDRFSLFRPDDKGVLFQLGEPTECLWFAEGRAATRAEILASIDGGYPELEKIAHEDGDLDELTKARDIALKLLPAS